MAFLLNKTTLSAVRLHSQLLAEDPSLRLFKSHRKSLKLHKKVADVLTIIVVSACCSEMYNRAEMRKEARKEKKSA